MVMNWLAGWQTDKQARLSTLAFISWKQMGRRGKTVPRGMYELYDFTTWMTILRMGREQARVCCLASTFFNDELTILKAHFRSNISLVFHTSTLARYLSTDGLLSPVSAHRGNKVAVAFETWHTPTEATSPPE
jgi:hypothetical protein